MIRTIVALAGLILAFPATAQEPIRFARTPDISPDGKLIVFSYLGDLWTVEAIGGVARPVTMHERVGEHDGTGQKAFVNRMPSRQTRSNTGVRTTGSPFAPAWA